MLPSGGGVLAKASLVSTLGVRYAREKGTPTSPTRVIPTVRDLDTMLFHAGASRTISTTPTCQRSARTRL